MLEKQLRRIRLTWHSSLLAWLGPAIVLVILLASLILGWLMRDLVQELIVDRAAFTLRSMWLYLHSFSQEEVWVLLVLLAIAHMVMTISRRFSLPPLGERIWNEQIGPVRGWMETLEFSAGAVEMGRISLNRLQHVTLRVLGQRRQQSMKEMRTQLRTGRLDIDPTLHSFLQTGRSQAATSRTPITRCPEMESLLDLLDQEVRGNR